MCTAHNSREYSMAPSFVIRRVIGVFSGCENPADRTAYPMLGFATVNGSARAMRGLTGRLCDVVDLGARAASRVPRRSAEKANVAADEFDLRNNRIQEIFDEEIKPALLADRPGRPLKQVDETVLYVVGGQPGAGKSTLVDSIRERLSDTGGAALIQADELEKFHPAYSRLYRENDFTAHDRLYPTAQKLRNVFDEFLIPRPYNVLLEGGNTDPRGTLARIKRIGESRSRTVMEVIALPKEQSDLARLERFVHARETDGFGRYLTRQTHNTLYLGSAELVRLIESERPIPVDLLRIRTRVEILFENHRISDEQWHDSPHGWATLEAERNREWTSEERRTFEDRVARLGDLVDARMNEDPARWAPLVDEIEGIRVLAAPKLSRSAT
ncbi:zeta toxin family protein [Nocardia sp. NPDC003963]